MAPLFANSRNFSNQFLRNSKQSKISRYTCLFTLQHFDCSISNPPRVFEMVITPDLEYPIVCTNVRRGGFDRSRSLKLDMVNLNSAAKWYDNDSEQGGGPGGLEAGEGEDMDGCATVIPRHELVNVQSVVQLEKDTILVCYDSEISST